MIHLTNLSINPNAIAYIDWNAIAPGTRTTDNQRGVLIHFLVPMGGGESPEFDIKPDYWFFAASSPDSGEGLEGLENDKDIKTLKDYFKRQK